MDVKDLIGVNAFYTADNICGTIRIYRANLGLELQDIIKGAKYMHFRDIDNPAFAKTLFEYLLHYAGREEALISDFFYYVEQGKNDMEALMEAVKEQ